MPDADHDRLVELARRKGLKRPEMIRELMRWALDRAEAGEREERERAEPLSQRLIRSTAHDDDEDPAGVRTPGADLRRFGADQGPDDPTGQERTSAMRVAITDDTGRILGYAARVLDFANPEPEMGGRDPRAPLTFSTLLVRGKLRIGHTYDAADENARIWLEEQPSPAGCGIPTSAAISCVTKSTIAYQHGDTWMILQHTRLPLAGPDGAEVPPVSAPETLYGPLAPTTARWKNSRRRVRDELTGEWTDKWRKVLAHNGPMTQFAYGTDTPTTWTGRFQKCQVCTWQSGALGVDVDYEDLFASTRTARLVGREQAFTVRGRFRYHILVDGRWVPEQHWPGQGPIAGADIKSNGFIPVPNCWHYEGDLYELAHNPAIIVPATPELMAAIGADRADADAARVAGRYPGHGGSNGNGQGGGPCGDLEFYSQHGIPVGVQDDELYRLACRHVRSMSAQELADRLWACVQRSPQHPGDPWLPEDIADKIRRAAEFATRSDAATRQAYTAWMTAMGGGR